MVRGYGAVLSVDGVGFGAVKNFTVTEHGDSSSVPRVVHKSLEDARRNGVQLNLSGTFNGEAWLEVFARQKRDRQSALRLSRFFGIPMRVNGQGVEERSMYE